jgi:drug/metabolite transporter (DMT)-like permease
MKTVPVKQFIFDLYETVKESVQPLHPRNQSEKTRALVAVGLVSFFWGTTWLASKKGVEHMPALQLAGIRQLIGGAFYIIYFFFKGFGFPSRQQLFQFIWMSVLMFVISNGFSTWSVQYIPSGLGAVIGAISPIWIALFTVLLFREVKLNMVTIAGLVLGFGGILVIFSDYLQALLNSSFAFGIMLGVIATMTWALGTLYTVRHARNLNAYYSLGWQMFLSGIILTVVSFVSGQYIPVQNIPAVSWYSIAYLVVIGSIITFGAFIYALKRLPAAQASVYAYINPIVAVIIGSILNNEKLNIIIAVGTLVTLLGVYLVNTGFKKAKLKESV